MLCLRLDIKHPAYAIFNETDKLIKMEDNLELYRYRTDKSELENIYNDHMEAAITLKNDLLQFQRQLEPLKKKR